MQQHGPTLALSEEIHAEKYREPGESFRESMNRVAAALQDSPEHYHDFREILLNMRFLPGGRVQTAMGAAKEVTAYNCFVSGTIADSFVDGPDSIMAMATEAAATMRMGGGIGYDFSTLRPRGDLIRKLRSQSTGPLSFMDIYNSVCKCVASSGHRRGAQMGVLRIDHPDILEFIDAKTNRTRLTGFNISVAVTDHFMECLASDTPFPLVFEGRTYRHVDPHAVWEKLMRATWDWAEPGVLFIDAINRDNNLAYCETLAATNPCGEQPLPPYGACLLGSFNLTRYMRREGETWYFDWDQFGADIGPVVRAMDNVVDRTMYPLPRQRQEAQDKRRMGLGITGLANAAEAMGMPYGSPRFLAFEAQVLDRLARECYRAGALLAKEKGPFPLYREHAYLADDQRFVNRHFRSTGDAETLDMIKRYGIRNSHYLSIAPTGTISLAADNVSSGIEPVFSYGYDRTVNMPDGQRVERVDDYGVRVFGTKGRTTAQVTVAEHLGVLVAAARRVDSAVSKTCNVPPTTSWDDFKGIYQAVWEAGGKGCTTFNTGGQRAGILVSRDDEQDEGAQVCEFDPVSGTRECG
jgi:ribonucleoside-diphosphate reductase alpha chain